MRIAITAAEASGDRVAGQLARELKRLAPDVELCGTGGKWLREAGAEVIVDASHWGVIGIASALKLIPRMFAARQRLLAELRRRPPDALVPIDAGAFHLGFGPIPGQFLRPTGALSEERQDVEAKIPPGVVLGPHDRRSHDGWSQSVTEPSPNLSDRAATTTNAGRRDVVQWRPVKRAPDRPYWYRCLRVLHVAASATRSRPRQAPRHLRALRH